MYKTFCFLALFFSLHSFGQRGGDVTNTPRDTIGTTYALVVGISSYAFINPLYYADDDAELFESWLIDQQIAERKNVTKLIDSNATRGRFFMELGKLLKKAKRNDRVFLYFAGHGDVETDIKMGFLLCYDAQKTNYPGSGTIEIGMLDNFVSAFVDNHVKVILITDACRSGNLAGGLIGARNTLTALQSRFKDVIKMLSCQPNQLSEEKLYPDGGHGVFTYHLVNGLNGLADRDNDSTVTVRELEFYLDEVRTETSKKQTPKIDGDPDAKVATYEESLKQLALAKKTNAGTAAINRPVHRGDEDSTWQKNKYYKDFAEALRVRDLAGYETYNADYYLQEAIRTNQPAEMISDMKLELSAVLEDELQKWLNQYLRGEYDINKNYCYECLGKMMDYSRVLVKLSDKKDLRYKEKQVKNIFFNIFYKWTGRRKEEYLSYIAELKKADSLLPNQPWIYMITGTFYSDLLMVKEANEYFEKAMKLAPKWTYPLIDRGILYMNQYDYKNAERDFRKALKLDSTLMLCWFNLGVLYAQSKNFNEAEKYYKKAIEINPGYTHGQITLGNFYLGRYQYDSAAKYFLMASTTDPKESEALMGLADIAARKMNFKFADSLYKAGLALDYKSSNLVQYATFLFDRKDYRSADSLYRYAVQSDPFYTYGWYSLGYFYEKMERFDEAEETYKKALSLDSLNTNIWAGLGKLYITQSKFKEAESALNRALRIDSLDSYSWSALGLLYIKQNKYSLARPALRRALSLDSLDTWATANLGFTYEVEGNYKEAAKWFERAANLNGMDTYAWYHLAKISFIQNQVERAAIYAISAIQSDSTHASAKELLLTLIGKRKDFFIKTGLALLRENYFEKAEIYFRQVIIHSPTDAEAWLDLAAVYAASGENAKAIESLSTAISNGFASKKRLSTEKYFDAIRSSAEFIELVGKMK